MNDKLHISILPRQLSVCRLDAKESVPAWLDTGEFYSITRTRDELSIVCIDSNIPEGITAEKGWRALKVEGPLDFALVGILAKLANALAEAGVSIFAISTYDTDYILVKEDKLEKAKTTLEKICTIQNV